VPSLLCGMQRTRRIRQWRARLSEEARARWEAELGPNLDVSRAGYNPQLERELVECQEGGESGMARASLGSCVQWTRIKGLKLSRRKRTGLVITGNACWTC